jgi:hypothetical protein
MSSTCAEVQCQQRHLAAAQTHPPATFLRRSTGYAPRSLHDEIGPNMTGPKSALVGTAGDLTPRLKDGPFYRSIELEEELET